MACWCCVSISTTSILQLFEENAIAREYNSPGRSSATISTSVAVSHASESKRTWGAAAFFRGSGRGRFRIRRCASVLPRATRRIRSVSRSISDGLSWSARFGSAKTKVSRITPFELANASAFRISRPKLEIAKAEMRLDVGGRARAQVPRRESLGEVRESGEAGGHFLNAVGFQLARQLATRGVIRAPELLQQI